MYVGRGDAIERENRLRREAAELEVEKRIRSLSASQVLTNHKAAVEDKLDELENAPTEDVAQRARESMVEVWKVATTSKNLKGGYIKMLKQAAAVGTATAEVLSNRADNSDSESDALKQIKALRRELEQTRREVKTAREEAERAKREAEKLRKELTELKENGGTKRKGRAVIEDSPPLAIRTDKERRGGVRRLHGRNGGRRPHPGRGGRQGGGICSPRGGA